jgi:molybdopterin/thiamine biosynthesis adenylyltransferase
MQRIVWTSSQWKLLHDHFLDAKNRETGAFLLVTSVQTYNGTRLLVQQTLLPPAGALELQGSDALRPSGQWLSAVISAALASKAGLGFIHSHPNSGHPPELSALDWETSVTWSKSIGPMLNGPFASLVWSPRGVTGVMFDKNVPGQPIQIERAQSLGGGSARPLHPTVADARDTLLDDRQVRAMTALGNKRIRDFSVAVIGLGGTGSPVAEQLTRLGVARLVLIDPDVIDDVSNLRRITGSRPKDFGAAKAEVVGRYLRSLELGPVVDVMCEDVRRETVLRRILDCDLVINTTDTQSSRAFLNQVSYQYYLPLIDVGVRVGTKLDGSVSGMPAEVRVLLPDNGCLWCRKVLDSQAIYEENLPQSERDKLAHEGYVQAVTGPQPSVIPLNYFGAAAATTTSLRLLSGQPVPSASVVFDAWEQYVHRLNADVDPLCICKEWRGKGDSVQIAYLPQ